ncbi:hypothetical protein ZWY2020_037000 [Hordeum vulgare]|nr:hypothetical protein ZWY2020_037000 [Hordeum vulgare]
MQHTVLPKAALGTDRYLSPLTTIADVELSNKLKVDPGCLCARCKCPCLGMRGGKKVAMSGLKDKTKYVRSQIGKRMKLCLMPKIRFIEDESMKRGSRALQMLPEDLPTQMGIRGKGQISDGVEAGSAEPRREGGWGSVMEVGNARGGGCAWRWQTVGEFAGGE